MADMNNKVDGSDLKDFYGVREQEQKDESQLTADHGGELAVSTSAATGFVEVELPSLGINPTERLLVRDFGPHVAAKLETAMNTGYLRKHSPAQVLRHYVGCAQGAQLMDEQALKRFDTLASEFEAEPEKQQFFEVVVRPYLLTLAPKRR